MSCMRKIKMSFYTKEEPKVLEELSAKYPLEYKLTIEKNYFIFTDIYKYKNTLEFLLPNFNNETFQEVYNDVRDIMKENYNERYFIESLDYEKIGPEEEQKRCKLEVKFLSKEYIDMQKMRDVFPYNYEHKCIGAKGTGYSQSYENILNLEVPINDKDPVDPMIFVENTIREYFGYNYQIIYAQYKDCSQIQEDKSGGRNMVKIILNITSSSDQSMPGVTQINKVKSGPELWHHRIMLTLDYDKETTTEIVKIVEEKLRKFYGNNFEIISIDISRREEASIKEYFLNVLKSLVQPWEDNKTSFTISDVKEACVELFCLQEFNSKRAKAVKKQLDFFRKHGKFDLKAEYIPDPITKK